MRAAQGTTAGELGVLLEGGGQSDSGVKHRGHPSDPRKRSELGNIVDTHPSRYSVRGLRRLRRNEQARPRFDASILRPMGGPVPLGSGLGLSARCRSVCASLPIVT